MDAGQSSSLEMPSFLHGIYAEVGRKTRKEGQRCGEQYRKEGSFPAPRDLLEVPRGEVVIAHEVVDFQHARPVWRLHMVSNVMSALYETVDVNSIMQARDAYEDFCRATAWGALYFVISPTGPVSSERTSRRLDALLSFWGPLQSVRYLFQTLDAALTLEELLMAACGWAVEAWCPVGEAPFRERLALAAERMSRATRDDSMAAILRQMPRALAHEPRLKHRETLADPTFQRQRLEALDGEAFAHVSAAATSMLIRQLHLWDRQLGTH
jgi:hypothetical protein